MSFVGSARGKRTDVSLLKQRLICLTSSMPVQTQTWQYCQWLTGFYPHFFLNYLNGLYFSHCPRKCRRIPSSIMCVQRLIQVRTWSIIIRTSKDWHCWFRTVVTFQVVNAADFVLPNSFSFECRCPLVDCMALMIYYFTFLVIYYSRLLLINIILTVRTEVGSSNKTKSD